MTNEKQVQTQEELQQHEVSKFGLSEVLYLAGLVMLFIGLLIWLGFGIGLSVCGVVLIITAIWNEWMRYLIERQEKHVI